MIIVVVGLLAVFVQSSVCQLATDCHTDGDWVAAPKLTMVILGATGDLAQRKLFPSLLQLLLDEDSGLRFDDVLIVAYARQELDSARFRHQLVERGFLPTAGVSEAQLQRFLACCHYVRGDTGVAQLAVLGEALAALEQGGEHQRIFFLSLPPKLFGGAAEGLHRHCRASGPRAWTRLVVEKPFGTDVQSAEQLLAGIGQHWDEQEIYRIDHYLGKSMVQQLRTLRSLNAASLGRLLDRSSVARVLIGFSERLGNEGRPYFDEVGIVRDVVQNHLLQMLALFAAAPLNASATPEAVRDAKAAVLQRTRVLPERCAAAQYHGYRSEKGVPSDSTTATFAWLSLAVDTERWAGVPFELYAGKAMDQARVFVQADLLSGEQLVVEVQPRPSVALSLHADAGPLRLVADCPRDALDPYAKLLLAVSRGDSSLFVRADELLLSWQIVQPLLQPVADEQLSRYARGDALAAVMAQSVLRQ